MQKNTPESQEVKVGAEPPADSTKAEAQPLQEPAKAEEQQRETQRSPDRTNFPTPPGIEMSEIFPGVVKPIAERTIYQWQSPARVFKKRNSKYLTNLTTIVLLLSLILFFSGQVLTVAVVLSVAFMAYVMTSIPPHKITQKITTYGIRQEAKIYYWEELGRFWFETKHGQIVMKVEVGRFPNQLILVVNNEDEKKLIRQYLADVLLEQKPEPTTTDKVADWLTKKFPIDLEGA